LALCVFALLCGVGYTVVDVMGNSAVTEYFLSKSNLLLPMVQIVFGVGTMIGPILITSMLVPGNPQSFTNSFLLIGGVCLAMACGYVVSLKTALPFLPKIDLKKMADSARQNPAEIFRSWKSWMILASCSMFTCFFTSAIAWYPTFFAQERGMNTEEAALMLTLFYVGMLVMRVISPFLLRKIRPQRIYVLFNIFSISCMLIAMNTPSVSMAAVFTVIGGAFLSLNVICVIMIATMLFPTRKASASSLAVFSYNIGGMVAPALVGAMAESMGLQTPLNIMCAVFAAGVVLMAVLSCKCKKELQEF
jgi:fucose permease